MIVAEDLCVLHYVIVIIVVIESDKDELPHSSP